MSNAQEYEPALVVSGDMDRKVIMKDYQFNKRAEDTAQKEYVYEVVYLVNVVTPRVGEVLTQEQVIDLQESQKLTFEIKSSKATIVR